MRLWHGWSRRLPSRLLAPIVALCLAGCAPSESSNGPPGVTDERILIGTWAPLTGPAAAWGTVSRGMQTLFQLVNAEGGIHGRQVELLIKDDGYQPVRTVGAVKQLVERDQVLAMVGGVGTAPGMAVKDYLTRHGVPWVGPASGAHNWAYPPSPNIFSTAPMYFTESAVLVDYAVQTMGMKRLAIFYLNDDFGKSGLVGARLALSKHGLEPVAEVSSELLDSDLTSQTLRLKESGAEGVFIWATPKHAAVLVGQAAKLALAPQWFATYVLADQNLMHEITEGKWEGTIYASPGANYLESTPLMEKYRRARERFLPQEREGLFFYSGFAYAEVMVEGLRRAGPDLTRGSLIRALESIEDHQGISGEMSFGPAKRQGMLSVYLIRCTGAAEFEKLTDWITPQVDIEEAIQELR